VKNANVIMEKIASLGGDPANDYAVSEMRRRFGFEFNGMRNHEVYFRSFEDGPQSPSEDSMLKKMIEAEGGKFDGWLSYFKSTAMTRGVGWAILYYDPVSERLITSWVDEQHLGQLQSCTPVLALDMWEHSFVYDYQPSGKKNYVEDFFKNLNWSVIEENFDRAKKCETAIPRRNPAQRDNI